MGLLVTALVPLAGLAITAYGVSVGLAGNAYKEVALYYLHEAAKFDEHADYIIDNLP